MPKSEQINICSPVQESEVLAVPDSRFECPICLAWLRNPILTSCGHRFCKDCMDDWLKRKNATCPIDNTPLDKSDIFPDNFTQREIAQQKVNCPNLSNGCLLQIAPLDVDTHLNTCNYARTDIECTFVRIGCCKTFRNNDELKKHIDSSVREHLTLLFSAYVGPDAAAAASFWDPEPKQPSHSQSNDINSLLRTLFEKIVKLEQKTCEQDIIIANLTERLNSMQTMQSDIHLRYCGGCYLWTIKDFARKLLSMRNNTTVMQFSHGFFITPNTYKICARINITATLPKYMSVFVHLMKSENDPFIEWPFCGKIILTLLNSVNPSTNITEVMATNSELDAFKRPQMDMNLKGFGYKEYILLDDLLTKGFAHNDEILIKVQAQSFLLN